MTQRLYPDQDSIAILRSTLDRVGYDVAQESLRADYLTSPFPHYETFTASLEEVDASLGVALRFLSLGHSIQVELLQAALGNDFAEAVFASGLAVVDDADGSASTAGFVLASRLGQYFLVSTNPYFPTFKTELADVYLGPESFALVNHLQRRAGSLPSSGQALDLCSGSGIAGQSIGAIRRGLEWTAIDLSPLAIETANFNAALNNVAGRYSAVQGDLYTAVPDQRFALIVANPPFVPVPDGTAFPVYGNGGEDGLLVMRPLLEGLTGRLTGEGRAIIYAEGIGDHRGPFVLDILEHLSANGYSIGVTLTATMNAERTLFSIGRVLSMQRPARLDELAKWQESFVRQGVTRYDKMLIEIRPGTAGVVIRSIAATMPTRITKVK